MTKKYFFCILIYSFFINLLSAQNSAVDSLFSLYEQASEDSIKIDFLNQLITINWDLDREKTIEYNEEILKITEKGNLKERRLKAIQSLGSQYSNLRLHRLAIDYLHQAIAYREEHQLSKVPLEKLYADIGTAHNFLAEYTEAADYFQKSLDLATAHQDSYMIANVSRNLGDLFAMNNKHEKALEYFFSARNFFQSWDNPAQPFQLSTTNFRIGEVYRKTAEQEENKAIREVNFQEAENYFAEGLENGKDNPKVQWVAYMYLSIMNEHRGEYAVALDYAKKMKEPFARVENDYYKITGNLRVARVLSAMGEYSNSILHADSALVYAENKAAFWSLNIGIKQLKFDAYSSLGEYKKALTLLPAMKMVRDSLNQQELKREVASMESNHELAKKKQELAQQQLQLDNQNLLLAKQTQQRNYLFFLSLLLVGLLTISYYAYRQKESHNRKLAKLNKMIQLQANELKVSNANLKDFSNTLSHDILSQIELIISMTGLNALKNSTEVQQKSWLEVKGIAKKLKDFAIGLITLSRIEAESKSLTEVDLNAVLTDIKQAFRQQFEDSNAQIEITTLPTILAHEVQMTQLFQNLIGNAIKYKKTDISLAIKVTIEQEGDNYLFSVKDNGSGIPAEKLSSVFESFTRIPKGQSGSGLGLPICKKIVEYYGGKIWLASDLGKGTTVYFTYPM